MDSKRNGKTTSPFPPNDEARVEVLHAIGILDTLPEAEYDELTKLAAQICQVPIAMISLIDRDRQWFKSYIGVESVESPRRDSFCAHVICEPDRDVFVVPDARRDPRFAHNPFVLGDPNIRFYAGAPLVTHDGWALGTLCVIDRQPRQLTPQQLEGLAVLRRHVVNSVELRRMVGGQRRAIAELEQAKSELEEARNAAQDAVRAKADFLAAMSHEIRTPMNAVIGMATLLQGGPLSAEQSECVRVLRDSGELLLTVVNDILDFSKIESGKLELEHIPFDLASAIAGAVELVAERAKEKGLTIVTRIAPGTPGSVRGDPTRVRQILINLLSNAVKFTERGSITVGAGHRSLPGGRIELNFSVRDQGVGIPADRIDRLFQHFSQADASTARLHGGSGLGLVISKRLAEMHGGGMTVESKEGEGSCFRFSIAAEPAEAVAPSAPAPSFDPGFAARNPASILVAEDNPVNQKVIKGLLTRLGYSPTLAGNGREAVALLRDQAFDVVLMDVEMPEMDGETATRALRAELPAGRQPVVIALTAHALDGRRDRYLAAGMDGYLSKPIRIAELTATLAQIPAMKQRRES